MVKEGYLKISLVNQGIYIKKRRNCPLKDLGPKEINYKRMYNQINIM